MSTQEQGYFTTEELLKEINETMQQADSGINKRDMPPPAQVTGNSLFKLMYASIEDGGKMVAGFELVTWNDYTIRVTLTEMHVGSVTSGMPLSVILELGTFTVELYGTPQQGEYSKDTPFEFRPLLLLVDNTAIEPTPEKKKNWN